MDGTKNEKRESKYKVDQVRGRELLLNLLDKSHWTAIVFAFLVISGSAIAKRLYALYQFPGSAEGKCLPKNRSDAAGVLLRNGIKFNGRPSSKELQYLATGLEQIERLRGGRTLPNSWKTPFNFIDTSGGGTWNQGVSAINVRRAPGSNGGANVTRLMHELGHKVGNTGVYDRYRKFIGRSECHISPYCSKRHNEQFAEVFAGFITRPDDLRKQCPKAFDFFSTQLFPESTGALASCGGGKNSRIPSNLDDGSLNANQTPAVKRSGVK